MDGREYVVSWLIVSFSVMQINYAMEVAVEGGTINGPEKRLGGATCSKDNIKIFHGAAGTLPSDDITVYIVTIVNMCDGCSIANIHLSCGWFRSAVFINRKVFRRLGYNDCLVNNGVPLGPNKMITFEYANKFSYPLSVASVSC